MLEERNADHYSDEAVACNEKIFESIGLAQLSFRPDRELDGKIAAAQSMLTSTDDVLRHESPLERLAWVISTKDAEKQISKRQKQNIVYVQKHIQPLTDLSAYLNGELSKGS